MGVQRCIVCSEAKYGSLVCFAFACLSVSWIMGVSRAVRRDPSSTYDLEALLDNCVIVLED